MSKQPLQGGLLYSVGGRSYRGGPGKPPLPLCSGVSHTRPALHGIADKIRVFGVLRWPTLPANMPVGRVWEDLLPWAVAAGLCAVLMLAIVAGLLRTTRTVPTAPA